MLPGLGPMVPGVPVTAQVEQASPLDGSLMHFLAQGELRRVDATSAEIRISTTANPEDATRALAGFMAKMLAAITDSAQRQATEAGMAKLGPMTISDEAVMTIGLPSGAAEDVRYRKQLQIPGQPARIDTRSYVRAK